MRLILALVLLAACGRLGFDDTDATLLDEGSVSDDCVLVPDLTFVLSQGPIIGYNDTTGYANDTEPLCTGSLANGPDWISAVQVEAGQIFTATVHPTGWDASIYITNTCERSPSCLIGANAASASSSETVRATIPVTGLYYLVVDGGVNDYGPFSVDIELE